MRVKSDSGRGMCERMIALPFLPYLYLVLPFFTCQYVTLSIVFVFNLLSFFVEGSETSDQKHFAGFTFFVFDA